MNPQISQNAVVAYRAQLIEEIKTGESQSEVRTEAPRLVTLCRSSWITFIGENLNSEGAAKKLGHFVERHVVGKWGDYYINKITVPEIDAWVRMLAATHTPATVRRIVGVFRRDRRQGTRTVRVASDQLGPHLDADGIQ